MTYLHLLGARDRRGGRLHRRPVRGEPRLHLAGRWSRWPSSASCVGSVLAAVLGYLTLRLSARRCSQVSSVDIAHPTRQGLFRRLGTYCRGARRREERDEPGPNAPRDRALDQAARGPATVLDLPVRAVEPTVQSVFGTGNRASVLRGDWLGHAVHPVLTDVVIGTWTSREPARPARRPGRVRLRPGAGRPGTARRCTRPSGPVGPSGRRSASVRSAWAWCTR